MTIDEAARRCDAWLKQTFTIALVVTGAVAALPLLLAPPVSLTYLTIVGLGAAIAWVVSRAGPAEERRPVMTAFVWALAVRLVALCLLWRIALSAHGPFLGPDSTSYFDGAWDLAASRFRLVEHPIDAFGSFNLAQYYVFAALIRYLHADLFALQLFNCVCTALIAPLMYGTTRRLVPAWAPLIAVVLAFYPSFIAISANDLLKDPSVILAMIVVLRALVDLGGSRRRAFALAAAPVVALIYLRMSRGYVVFHAEFAAAGGAAYFITRRGWRVLLTRTALVVMTVFVIAEAVPMTMGWPPSPANALAQIRHALGTPAMREADPGLFARRQLADSFEQEGGRGGSPLNPINVFRKVYGPYVWILPAHISSEQVLRADYLLYPGMAIWYVVLPIGLAGLVFAGLEWTRSQPRLPLGLVPCWIFVITFGMQYLTINLSYRQREGIVPLMALFVLIGAAGLAPWRRWLRVYAAYWGLLVITAAAHLAVRAWLNAP